MSKGLTLNGGRDKDSVLPLIREGQHCILWFFYPSTLINLKL